MIIKALRKSESARLVIGLSVDIAGLTIGAAQYLHNHTIF